MEVYHVLDASSFINGYVPSSDNNYTVPEITAEIQDFESRLLYDSLVDEGRLIVQEATDFYIDKVEFVISKSGDVLRLSAPDKIIIALALMFFKEGKSVKMISDDYTIQNTLKIMNIPFSSVLTEGIKEVYNWKNICMGCKKEFSENYPFDDCDVCGSNIIKKRIRVNK